jgi:pimeloyl-ACP methyl ester carboxylesterase
VAAPPVLLITGVGMAASVALRTAPVLAEHFRVLAFHAAGPAEPVADGEVMARLAGEAVAMLDAAGAADAHVYGISFGGMVAQELALRHPDRVRALVLGATSAGGELRVPPEPAAREFITRRPSLPPEEGLWASVPYGYSQRTRRRYARRIGEDIAARMRAPVDRQLHRVQRDAAIAHDTAARLQAIAVPTLVVHGDEDRMVPAANGFLLRDAIPGAELLVLQEAAHVYPTDEPEGDQQVAAFLRDQGASRSRRAASRSRRAASGSGRAAPA